MEITLTVAENEVFESLVEMMSDEIAIAHLMQCVEFEVFVEEEEENEEAGIEEEETKGAF